MTLDIAKLKAAAEKATALNLDTAEIKREHDECAECPICSGEGYVDVDADYCNIDGVALGVLFYGIGEHHGLAEEYFRAANPAAVLELIAALEAKDALIAELDERLLRYAGIATRRAEHVAELEKRIAELEARTVSVKIKPPTIGRAYSALAHVWTVQEVREACTAAGINLETGGE